MRMNHVVAAMLALSTLIPLGAAAREPGPALAAGAYECRVSKEYAFRACSVELREGVSWLKMPGDTGYLVAFEGPVVNTEEKGVLYVEAAKRTDTRPWGCTNCAERCTTDPASCECKELPPEATKACLATPIQLLLKSSGGAWKGTLPYKVFGHEYKDGKPVGTSVDIYVLDVTIRRAK